MTDSWSILVGDALTRLRELPEASVQCCVTSPPYWGLRDYGVAGQLGLEKTPSEYVANMVAVFEEVRRVLRPDGTLFCNVGDSYCAGGAGGGGNNKGNEHGQGVIANRPHRSYRRDKADVGGVRHKAAPALKPKDMVGIPWLLAFALRDAGWWLRSEIIWGKKSPMPESVRDRPTKAHEQVFLFVKGQWKSRVVAFSNLASEFVHFCNDGRFQPSNTWPAKVCIRLASSILNLSERKQALSLPPFYSEVWKHGARGGDSDFVRSLPIEYWPAVWASRLFASHCSTEEFLEQLNRLLVALPDRNDLLKSWCSPEFGLSPSVNSNGETSIAIHDASEICKVDFSHNQIVVSTPTTCKYFYDQEAERVPAVSAGETVKVNGSDGREVAVPGMYSYWTDHRARDGVTVANKRNLWTYWTDLSPEPFPEAHFATFPPDLPRRCIRLGTSERGCCAACGAPWERVVEPVGKYAEALDGPTWSSGGLERGHAKPAGAARLTKETTTTGWSPGCDCNSETIGCLVLDPFAGAGTTIMVARRLGCRAIGIELNESYAAMARKRILEDAPLFNGAT